MTNVAHDLYRQTEAAKMVLAQYADILGDDAQAKADTVEGETNLKEAIEKALARVIEIDALEDSIKGIRDALDTRLNRLREQRELLRTSLGTALEVAGEKRIETALATVVLKPTPPKVEVVDESSIPARFWKRADPKLDKKAVLDALKAREVVPGATLSNGGVTVQITSR